MYTYIIYIFMLQDIQNSLGEKKIPTNPWNLKYI